MSESQKSSQIFQAKVLHLSQQGLGVVKAPDGKTYFVRGVWRGDEVELQATLESEGSYHFAELINIIKASPERSPIPCPHFGTGPQQCFGCPWIMAQYSAQIEEKQHRVRYALERIGIKDPPVLPIWPAPKTFHYRRRAQFKTDALQLGYAGRQGSSIASIDSCAVLSEAMAKHLKALREQLPKAAWQPDAAHRWSFLDLDEESDPYHVEINRRRPFQQANAEQNEAMRQWIANELVICDRSSSVLELFSGSGNFTEVLVQLGFKSILASEVGTQAMAELAQKQWTGVRTQRLNLYHPLAIAEVLRLASDTQIVLANPPRAGLLHMNRLLPKLRHLQTILYVSCDPVSFASDARRIIKNGFELKKVQALDQMPQTPHVEILGRFDRVLNS